MTGLFGIDPSELTTTGVPVAVIAGGGALLIVLGVVFALVGRRKPPSDR